MSAENRVGDDPITERTRNRSAALAVAARTGILTNRPSDKHTPSPARQRSDTRRYKGRASLKVIESKFPHHVVMMVLEGRFATRLDSKH